MWLNTDPAQGEAEIIYVLVTCVHICKMYYSYSYIIKYAATYAPVVWYIASYVAS